MRKRRSSRAGVSANQIKVGPHIMKTTKAYRARVDVKASFFSLPYCQLVRVPSYQDVDAHFPARMAPVTSYHREESETAKFTPGLLTQELLRSLTFEATQSLI